MLMVNRADVGQVGSGLMNCEPLNPDSLASLNNLRMPIAAVSVETEDEIGRVLLGTRLSVEKEI